MCLYLTRVFVLCDDDEEEEEEDVRTWFCFVCLVFVDATLKSISCQSGTPVMKEAAPYCTHCETVLWVTR